MMNNLKKAELSPESLAKGKAIVEDILAKNGKIKVSDIPPKMISSGREFVEKLAYSQIIFTGKPTRFDEIDTSVELVHYLSSRAKTTELSEQYVSHYTSYDVASKILSNKMLHLNNPKNMNDGLEFSSDAMDASKIYFTSFTLENRENIAMWSMYGQPWEKGVKLSIPKKIFMDWLKQIKEVYNIDPDTCMAILSDPINEESFIASISRVAYVEWSDEGDVKTISCGDAKNEKLKSVDVQLLTGLIKDAAWAYEKEIRLRVDLKERTDVDRIAVAISNEVMDSLIVTTGPRFDEKVTGTDIKRATRVEKSIFDGKLNYIYCDRCVKKKIDSGSY